MPKGQAKRQVHKSPRTPRGATQGDGPAYQSQPTFRVRLPGVQSLYNYTVTSGLVASSISVGTGAITGFATRFGSTFDEYRVLGARVRLIPASVSTGITHFWFDEKSSATPTATEALERVAWRRSNNSADDKSCFTAAWTARDLLDLQYTAIGTPTSPVYFKLYTDLANYGAPAAAGPAWLVNVEIFVEFRGLKST